MDDRTINDIITNSIYDDYPFGEEPFGDLLVLYFTGQDDNTGAWKVKCYCTKCNTLISESLLFDSVRRYGKSSKCLCKVLNSTKANDIIGKQFNDLLAVEVTGRSETTGDIIVKCLCTRCNKNYIETSYNNLTKAKNPIAMCDSCNRKEKNKIKRIKIIEENNGKDIVIGHKYGRVIPISKRLDMSLKRKPMMYWKCKCELCGHIDEYEKRSLLENNNRCLVCKNIPDLREHPDFGRLKVKKLSKIENGVAIWECECQCEKHTIVYVSTNNLTSGNTRSCGCLSIEENKSRSSHGMNNHNIRSVYYKMIDRCTNPDSDAYEDYGGRGIKVCDRWMPQIVNEPGKNPYNLGFMNFLEDMMDTYEEGLTLDRINVNGNYESENCRWATMKEQNRNKRNNYNVNYNGKFYYCAQDLVDEFIPYYPEDDPRRSSGVLISRLKNGWSEKEALIIPILSGESKKSWLKRHNITSDDQLPDKPVINAISFDPTLKTYKENI